MFLRPSITSMFLLFTNLAPANTCKDLNLVTDDFMCPTLTKACLEGDVRQGKIDLYNKSSVVNSFALVGCSHTRMDNLYCNYKNESPLSIDVFPEQEDKYELSGQLILGTFPLRPGYVYSCRYKIVNEVTRLPKNGFDRGENEK